LPPLGTKKAPYFACSLKWLWSGYREWLRAPALITAIEISELSHYLGTHTAT